MPTSAGSYATVQMQVIGTYTEPPGNYGQPVGSVVTTVSDTKPFTLKFWVPEAGIDQQITWARARADDKTKDMRQLGQVFVYTNISRTGETRANDLPTYVSA